MHVINDTDRSRALGLEQEPDGVEDSARVKLSDAQVTNSVQTGAASLSDFLVTAVQHAFDVLGIGWIVFDAESRVVGVNKTAEIILTSQDGLELDGHGGLRSTCGANTLLTEAIVRAAEPRRSSNSAVEDVTLSITRRAGNRPLTVVVRRVQKTLPNGPGRPMVLLLTLDSSACAVTPVDLYRLFSFTETEANLALLMMEGRTLENCCLELGVDLPVGKSNLKQLFKKTRTRHQTELVLALFKGVAIERLGEHSFEATASGNSVH